MKDGNGSKKTLLVLVAAAIAYCEFGPVGLIAVGVIMMLV